MVKMWWFKTETNGIVDKYASHLSQVYKFVKKSKWNTVCSSNTCILVEKVNADVKCKCLKM